MTLVGHVKKQGEHALSLTIHSIPIDPLNKIINRMHREKRYDPDPKKTGVPTSFIRAWSQANVLCPAKLRTTHADSYQFDEEENLLMHSGKVYREGQLLETNALLDALAKNIVENTLECFYTGRLDEIAEEAVQTSNGLAQETARHSLQNWMFVMSSVQLMKVVFEMLMRDKLHTQIDVFFDKGAAAKYHAFIDGDDLNPKTFVRRSLKRIRSIQMDVLGFKPQGADH